MSSAQPKGELHFDVHFADKETGPARLGDLSRDSVLIKDEAGSPHLQQLCLHPESGFLNLGKEISF